MYNSVLAQASTPPQEESTLRNVYMSPRFKETSYPSDYSDKTLPSIQPPLGNEAIKCLFIIQCNTKSKQMNPLSQNTSRRNPVHGIIRHHKLTRKFLQAPASMAGNDRLQSWMDTPEIKKIRTWKNLISTVCMLFVACMMCCVQSSAVCKVPLNPP